MPGLPEKGDIVDWIAGDGTAAALAELVANAPDFEKAKPKPKPTPNAAASLDGYDLTEDGIGLAFAKAHQDLLRYDHSTGRWFQWTGKAWRQDETGLAFSWSRRTCRQLAKEAGTEGGQLATLAKAATAAAVERFAQSDPALAVTSAIWDRDPFLLGTPGGTLDLRTAELRDPVREDYITKLTSVTPSVMPDCPLWLTFLDQVTKSDAGLILRNVDDAARRRFNMAPFLYKPPAKDMELEAKLLKEAPEILRWMIEGCLDWQKNGLIRPNVVVQANGRIFLGTGYRQSVGGRLLPVGRNAIRHSRRPVQELERLPGKRGKTRHDKMVQSDIESSWM